VQLGALADGYLSKPFDLVYLLAQVRGLLGEA
jgi:DNA-binding response OmpR family regulator